MRSISHEMRSCEYNRGGSALNQVVRGQLWSSTSVRLSCLGCLSYLAWFACSPSVSFLALPLCALSGAHPSWYIDVTIAFPRVPVCTFTDQVIARQQINKSMSYFCLTFGNFYVIFCKKNDKKINLKSR